MKYKDQVDDLVDALAFMARMTLEGGQKMNTKKGQNIMGASNHSNGPIDPRFEPLPQLTARENEKAVEESHFGYIEDVFRIQKHYYIREFIEKTVDNLKKILFYHGEALGEKGWELTISEKGGHLKDLNVNPSREDLKEKATCLANHLRDGHPEFADLIDSVFGCDASVEQTYEAFITAVQEKPIFQRYSEEDERQAIRRFALSLKMRLKNSCGPISEALHDFIVKSFLQGKSLSLGLEGVEKAVADYGASRAFIDIDDGGSCVELAMGAYLSYEMAQDLKMRIDDLVDPDERLAHEVYTPPGMMLISMADAHHALHLEYAVLVLFSGATIRRKDYKGPLSDAKAILYPDKDHVWCSCDHHLIGLHEDPYIAHENWMKDQYREPSTRLVNRSGLELCRTHHSIVQHVEGIEHPDKAQIQIDDPTGDDVCADAP